MPLKDILESEPKDLWYYDDAYKISMKQKDREMWMQGIYHVKAISCTVGNMFSGKNHQKDDYFKEPLLEKSDMSAKERKKRAEAFFAGLQVMQANFNLSKQEGGVS